MSVNHWYWGRKDDFILRALATGKYTVLAIGQVINNDVRGTGRAAALRTRLDQWGYVVVHLFDGEKRQPVLLHRVVALVHVPRQAGTTQVNHVDGEKRNCAAENLEWVTASGNGKHAYMTGLRVATVPDVNQFKGHEDHPMARLTEASVIQIRMRLAAGERQRTLADQFCVSQTTISNIARGRTWK